MLGYAHVVGCSTGEVLSFHSCTVDLVQNHAMMLVIRVAVASPLSLVTNILLSKRC